MIEIKSFDIKPVGAKNSNVELILEKDSNDEITDWIFRIDGSEEMSMSKSFDYELGMKNIMNTLLPRISNRESCNWVTVGGADYQLSKYYPHNTHSKFFSLLIDPLAGKLREIYSMVDPDVNNIPYSWEMSFLFSDFMFSFSESFLNTFDVAVVDVSDPDPSEVTSPDEVYTTKFLEDLSILMKKDSYLILYEGEKFSWLNEGHGLSEETIIVPNNYTLICKVVAGYGWMSLWNLK